MTFNSLIITHRNRHDHLRLCLDAISRSGASKPIEVVLVDLGSSESTQTIVDAFPTLPVQYHYIDYTGVFWKSKAINFAVTRAAGEYVTILDCDMMMPPWFLAGVEDFFGVAGSEKRKLGFKCKFLDQGITRQAQLRGMQWVNEAIFGRPQRYPNEFFETYQGVQTGNSQCTLLRSEFLRLGGYDERFIGYGWEDHAFNMVLARELGATPIHPTSVLYHLDHGIRRWHGGDASATQELFTRIKAEGFPIPTRGDDWGVFPGDLTK